MKDQSSYLDLMVRTYENEAGIKLSPHDPVFHAFVSVSHVCDHLSIFQDKEVRERYIISAMRRSRVLAHAIAYGYTPRFLEPDRHKQRVVFTGEIPEDVTFNVGQRIRTERQDGVFTTAEVAETYTARKGDTEAEVEIEVGKTVRVNLGQGTGKQESFALEGDHVYVNSLRLEIRTPTGSTERWTQVPDFLKSEPQSNHFIVEVGAKNFNDMTRPTDLMLYIRCGNGNSGRVFPDKGVITAIYKEVNPYTETMPNGVFTTWIDSVPYLDSTENIEVVKEKVLPESIEVLRRNAIYTKSIGNTLVTKEDFERAVIVQSVDGITKAHCEWAFDVEEGVNVYTIHCSGNIYPLPQSYLNTVRDKLYANYTRTLTDEYELVQAPVEDKEITLNVIYDSEIDQDRKDEIDEEIRDIINEYIVDLPLGATYSIPEMWKRLVDRTTTSLRGLDYVQIVTPPPVMEAKTELRIPRDNVTITEM